MNYDALTSEWLLIDRLFYEPYGLVNYVYVLFIFGFMTLQRLNRFLYDDIL